MGLYERDYARSSSNRGTLLPSGQQVYKTIIFANIGIFVLQLLSQGSGGQVTNALELDIPKVFESGQIWRLITYAFCHDPYGMLHIVFNMLAVFWFGSELEEMYGSAEFAAFYTCGALAAAFVQSALAYLTGRFNPAIGASGAIMAILILFTMHNPRHRVIVWFFPVEMRWLLTFYVIFDLHPVLLQLSGRGEGDGVAHAAHLGGLAFGFLYYWNGWRLTRFFSGFRGRGTRRMPSFRSRPKLRVYSEPEVEDRAAPPPTPRAEQALAAKVDDILKKISAQGEASLTQEERDLLVQASQRYRDKRN